MLLAQLGEVWRPGSFAAVGVVFDVVGEFGRVGGELGRAAEEGGED